MLPSPGLIPAAPMGEMKPKFYQIAGDKAPAFALFS
jgi:hypothetical protein